MHEMSLAEGIVQLLEEHARSQQFSRVKTVWLEIGRLSSVETESLKFCFDAVSKEGVAAGANLEIIEVPGRAWCMECSQEVLVEALYDPCPRCGGYRVTVTGGNEMRVKELEVV